MTLTLLHRKEAGGDAGDIVMARKVDIFATINFDDHRC